MEISEDESENEKNKDEIPRLYKRIPKNKFQVFIEKIILSKGFIFISNKKANIEKKKS